MLTLASLFAAALFAATILPFSSEALLAAAITAGKIEPWLLVAVASLGNTLGACINYALGAFLLNWQNKRWFPFSPAQLEKASDRFTRYGVWSLLLSWVPIIGDPLTFAAGVLKVRFVLFLALVAVGKTARYVFVAFAF